MANNRKKTILIDLDGVLNEYNGNYEKDCIPPIKKGADKFLKKLSEYFNVAIFTSRDARLVKIWLEKNKLNQYVSRITKLKHPAFSYIDDRGINFNNNFEETADKIMNFKPHWKK